MRHPDHEQGAPRLPTESPIINELLAERERTTKIGTLLRLMQRRYRDVPEELAATVRACVDGDRLDRWVDEVFEADNLAEFRRRTGL